MTNAFMSMCRYAYQGAPEHLAAQEKGVPLRSLKEFKMSADFLPLYLSLSLSLQAGDDREGKKKKKKH